MHHTNDSAYGAYGFRILGAADAKPLLNEVPADWPEIEIRQVVGPEEAAGLRVGSEDADLANPTIGCQFAQSKVYRLIPLVGSATGCPTFQAVLWASEHIVQSVAIVGLQAP